MTWFADSGPPGWYTPRRHWHFLRRLCERYGIQLERGDIEECIHWVAEGIRTGEAQVLRHHPKRGSCVVLLTYGDTEIQAVFQPNGNPGIREPGKFITALKPGSFLRDGCRWYRSPMHSQKDEEDRLDEPYVSEVVSECAMAGQLAGLMRSMSGRA